MKQVDWHGDLAISENMTIEVRYDGRPVEHYRVVKAEPTDDGYMLTVRPTEPPQQPLTGRFLEER
jgi:hypothetical protein